MESIVVSVVCGLLIVGGAVAAIRWGKLEFVRPWSTGEPETSGDESSGLPLKMMARRIAWYIDLVVLAGIAAGVLAAGPGGRLIMRLLAITSSDSAQGRITEAEEVVGAVTLGGTIILVVFAGAFSGMATVGLWVMLRRWLPSRRLGALVLGVLLLTLVSTRLEPLRPDNPDFDLVGPSGLAVATFIALAFFHAFVVVAFVGRFSRALPLLSKRPRVVLAYIPPLFLLLTGPILPVVVIVMGVAMFIYNRPAVRRAWSRRGVLVVGQIALVALTVLAIPSFMGDVTDILG